MRERIKFKNAAHQEVMLTLVQVLILVLKWSLCSGENNNSSSNVQADLNVPDANMLWVLSFTKPFHMHYALPICTTKKSNQNSQDTAHAI